MDRHHGVVVEVFAGVLAIGTDSADDGFASFVDIAPGSYTLHQTTAPDGYLPVDDREIDVASGENEPFLVEHEA